MTVEKIYWDSDAFLGWLQNEPDKVAKCQGPIKRATRGEIILFTSALTLTEVLWMKNAPKITQDKREILNRFFRRSFVRVAAVSRKIAETAQDVVWESSIKPKDAIHIATALHHSIKYFETFDGKLIKKSGKVGDPALIIREPKPDAQGSFDLSSQ